jgi:hypothetical protein
MVVAATVMMVTVVVTVGVIVVVVVVVTRVVTLGMSMMFTMMMSMMVSMLLMATFLTGWLVLMLMAIHHAWTLCNKAHMVAHFERPFLRLRKQARAYLVAPVGWPLCQGRPQGVARTCPKNSAVLGCFSRNWATQRYAIIPNSCASAAHSTRLRAGCVGFRVQRATGQTASARTAHASARKQAVQAVRLSAC